MDALRHNEDALWQVLMRVPFQYHAAVAATCRSFESIMASAAFTERRVASGYAEDVLLHVTESESDQCCCWAWIGATWRELPRPPFSPINFSFVNDGPGNLILCNNVRYRRCTHGPTPAWNFARLLPGRLLWKALPDPPPMAENAGDLVGVVVRDRSLVMLGQHFIARLDLDTLEWSLDDPAPRATFDWDDVAGVESHDAPSPLFVSEDRAFWRYGGMNIAEFHFDESEWRNDVAIGWNRLGGPFGLSGFRDRIYGCTFGGQLLVYDPAHSDSVWTTMPIMPDAPRGEYVFADCNGKRLFAFPAPFRVSSAPCLELSDDGLAWAPTTSAFPPPPRGQRWKYNIAFTLC